MAEPNLLLVVFLSLISLLVVAYLIFHPDSAFRRGKKPLKKQ